jgi:predicted permease
MFSDQTRDARAEGRWALARLVVKTSAALLGTAAGLNARDAWGDLRFAARQLSRRPTSTLGVIVTLTVGIAATTSLFSVVHAVLLRPLPYGRPHELVLLQSGISRAGQSDATAQSPTYAEFRAFGRTDVLASASVIGVESANLVGGTMPDWVHVASVSSNILRTLEVHPRLGRDFTDGEADAVILTDELWRRLFDADRRVFGRTLTLDGRPYRVVGVLPAGLGFLNGLIRGRLEMLRPLGAGTPVAQSQRFMVVARLARGVTAPQAAARLRGAAASALRSQPGLTIPVGSSVRVSVTPLHDRIVGHASTALWLLFGASAFVMAIACVNVANLLLGQAAARTREMAVRCSLGAMRQHLFRIFLAQSFLLSAAGTGSGVLLAWWVTSVLRTINPRSLPRVDEIRLDAPAVAYAALLGLLTTLLFSLVPLAWWRRRNLVAVLRQVPAVGRDRGVLLARLLVVAEVALSLVLLAGAGLMSHTFLRLAQRDLGYDGRKVLSLFVALRADAYTRPDQQIQFMQRLLADLDATPGVRVAGLVNYPLGEGTGVQVRVTAGADPPGSHADGVLADSRVISPGYLRAVGIPLLRGRDFSFRDVPGGARVLLVSAGLSRRLWGDGDPIGKPLALEAEGTGLVAGVVGDVRDAITSDVTSDTVYQAYSQTAGRFMNLMVKTDGEPLGYVDVVRHAVLAIDRHQSLHLPPTMSTLEQRLAGSVADRFVVLMLLGGFSVIGLVLASVGLYGLIAHGVRQRTQELGVRIAVGAQSWQVVAQVLHEGLALTALGVAVGLGGCAALTRCLRSMLVDLSTADPPALGGAVAILTLVAAFACALPARNATKVDPVVALRGD